MAASAATDVNVGGQGGDPERVLAALVTANTYDVLGVPPGLGRAFGPRTSRGRGTVAILTDAFWRRRFGADPPWSAPSFTSTVSRRKIVGVVGHGVVLPFEIGAAQSGAMSCCR